MNQWKAIAAILLIFGSGAGTGYLLKSRSTADPAQNPPGQASPLENKPNQRSVGPVFFRSLGHLNNHLELSKPQREKIGAIMDASRARIAEKGADFREVLEGEHAAWREAVQRELTPQQLKKFDRISNFRFRKEPGKPSGRPGGTRDRPPGKPKPKPKEEPGPDSV